MRSYVFRVVVEPDDGRWLAYCPALEEKGAVTWGNTREEALRNGQDVLQMVVEELLKDGEPLPGGSEGGVQVFSEPRVAVTV